jgi:hypothetical protein
VTVSLIAAFSAAALALLLRSALGLCRAAGSTDPSAEAHFARLALYGCGVAVLTLGLFIALA